MANAGFASVFIINDIAHHKGARAHEHGYKGVS